MREGDPAGSASRKLSGLLLLSFLSLSFSFSLVTCLLRKEIAAPRALSTALMPLLLSCRRGICPRRVGNGAALIAKTSFGGCAAREKLVLIE